MATAIIGNPVTSRGIKEEVVTTLPPTGKAGIIYFVPNNSGEADNIYDEYIWLKDAGKWEKLGTKKVNLDGYATEQWANDKFATIDTVFSIHAQISVWLTKTAMYKGETATTSISESVKFNGKNMKYTITVDGKPKEASYSVTDTKTFNWSLAIDNPSDPKIKATRTGSAAIYAYYPIYIGRNASATLDAAKISALASTTGGKKTYGKQSELSTTVTVSDTAASYLWICVPPNPNNSGETMTVNSVSSGGFSVPMEAYTTVKVNGVSYKCYRSSNQANAGSATFKIN